MHFFPSIVLGLMALATTIAQPTEPTTASLQARDPEDFRWISKRCCINCDNPYASCLTNDKREAVESEGDAIFGSEKRCSIHALDPCFNCIGAASCRSNGRRDGAQDHAEWPARRCCVGCDNTYAQCRYMDRREAVETLEDALFGSA